MTISPWSIPFFSPQKGASPVSTTPTLLTILRKNITVDTVLNTEARDDYTHLLQCPPVKMVPPAKAEQRQEMTI
jgi:hypothetical protein